MRATDRPIKKVTSIPEKKKVEPIKKPTVKKAKIPVIEPVIEAPVKVIEPIVEPKVEEEKIEIDLEDIRI